MGFVPRLVLAVLAASACLGALVTDASAKTTAADVQRGLERLVAAPAGPPGANSTLYRNGRMTTVRAGVADVKHGRAPRATDHMRIVSVTKASSGAVALSLVDAGKLGLDDTISQQLPGMPPPGGAVTVRQLLNHTSGMLDYTKSKGSRPLKKNARAYISPQDAIDFVRSEPLVFAPGSQYEYSNTDNIVIGLIAEAAGGEIIAAELERIVFGPARLRKTALATKSRSRSPHHGYATRPQEARGVSTLVSPSGAWASGGIVSTPRDLDAFIRAYLGLRFFDRAEQIQQMQFVPGGESVLPGPGRTPPVSRSSRYRTSSGTVYGDTRTFPGYASGSPPPSTEKGASPPRSTSKPGGKLLGRLRNVKVTAVCALLGK